MSLDAQDWVWEHSRSKGVARLVLLAVADKASGADCSAYAGTTMLMRRANASRRAVIDAVDTLLDLGEMEIVTGSVGPRGETRYRLPAAAKHRRGLQAGGADSAPVRNLHRCENCTGGGADSAPGGCTSCTGGGADSAPQNAVNAENARGTQREGRPSSTTAPTAPSAGALSLIPPDWQPSAHDVAAAQAARTAAGRPVLTGQQLTEVTRKFVRRMTSDRRQAPEWGARWQEWAERERPADTDGQAPLLGLLDGGQSDALWPHELPQQRAESSTPIPPTFAERMAQLQALTAADRDRSDTA